MKSQTNLLRPLTLIAVILLLLLVSHLSFAQARPVLGQTASVIATK